MKIQFSKMSGAGNDFVVVDNRTGLIRDPGQFAVTVCHRRSGIGADGLLLVESHPTAAFSMKYHNADGSNAGMCGNGGRCIAKFAHDQGIVSESVFDFEGFGFIYRAERIESSLYKLFMKDPHSHTPKQSVALDNLKLTANYLNTGTDHSVIFLDENPILGSIEKVDVIGIGKAVRYHDVYQPIGTNVNFVSRDEDNSICIRTYERGVEDETLACGTGSVASAILGAMRYGFTSPVKVKVQSGEILEIGFTRNGNTFSNVWLKGSAVETFRGEIEYTNK